MEYIKLETSKIFRYTAHEDTIVLNKETSKFEVRKPLVIMNPKGIVVNYKLVNLNEEYNYNKYLIFEYEVGDSYITEFFTNTKVYLKTYFTETGLFLLSKYNEDTDTDIINKLNHISKKSALNFLNSMSEQEKLRAIHDFNNFTNQSILDQRKILEKFNEMQKGKNSSTHIYEKAMNKLKQGV